MQRSKKPKKEKKPEVCRICLIAKDGNHVSFEVKSEWSQLLDYCFGITVKNECGPRSLCTECSMKLKDYSAFKTLALKSDTLWNNILTNKIKNEAAIETIEIKDEDDDDKDDDDVYQEEYLEITVNDEFQDDVSKTEISVDNEEIGSPEYTYETYSDAGNGSEHNYAKESKRINTKKQRNVADKIAKEDLKGLSQKQFIRQFFEVFPGKKPKYECLNCGKEFSRCRSLPLHVQKCHDSEVLIMKKPKKTKKTMKSDPDKDLPLPLVFDCGFCDFQDADEKVTLQHVNEHHCLTNDLDCKKCDFKGRDVADVITHRFKHMAPGYKYKYKCPQCAETKLNKLCLEFHYRSIHLKKPGGWCSICSKTLTGYIYFRNHVRLHKEENYICDYCGQKFLFRNLIEAHIKEHMNVRNYVCDTCGKSFKRNNALLGHIRAYHTDLKPVPCGHCNKQFKNAYSLKLHMRMVKKGNNFICDICCKGYATMSLMKKHRFWHTGERPYTCPACGGKYKSKGNLNLHMRKHMGIFPHKCDSCGKQFTTSTQLRAHCSVHTGVRRVKCLVCDRTFHEKRQMLAHCQSKHESYMAKHEGHESLTAGQGILTEGQSTLTEGHGTLMVTQPMHVTHNM